jgi:hypothetical protein
VTKHVLCAAVLLAAPFPAASQQSFEGLTLVSPSFSTSTYLIDMAGSTVRTWHGAENPASTAYLLEDGSLLRPCIDPDGHFPGAGAGGRVQRIDADDSVIWDFTFSDSTHQQHHDIRPLSNGNILLIAWEKKTIEEAQAAGRQDIDNEMWPTLIVEVEPQEPTGGNIVWEWHLWDHLIQDVDPEKSNYGTVAEHPELMDINFGDVGLGHQGIGDWIHANAVDYSEELDQIVFSSRSMNEFYVIDHSTTIDEAAGHTGGNAGRGGDLLYRWGNPQVYDRGTPADQQFQVVHGANWIDRGLPGEGNILVFNNGDRSGTANDYSVVEEIVPPLESSLRYYIAPGAAFGPSGPAWTYGGPGGFYGGPVQCGAYRLPNGNTLVCKTNTGYVFEVTHSGTTVWDYDIPGRIARAPRYWVDLRATLAGGALELEWQSRPGVAAYWVYGAENQTYFAPGLVPLFAGRVAIVPSGITTWFSPAGIGDPAHNWTYMVMAVDEGESVLARSNRVGEQEFAFGTP